MITEKQQEQNKELIERFVELKKRMNPDEDTSIDVSLSCDIVITSCKSGYSAESKERYSY